MRKSTTKSTTLKSLAKEATVLKAKRVKKPDIDPQALIDQAVKDAEKQDKEQALLQRELQKPMKQRNKALLDKYNILDSGKTFDNYPNLNSGINYEMTIQFPEDDDIALEARPSLKEWYVGLRISYKGNIFNYRFPIHYSTFHDGQQLYKLDGFPVYVDPAGTIRNDISEYTIFQALTDYSKGDLNRGQVNEMFYRYGVIDEKDLDADILKEDVHKNFAIKGVYVTSQAIKPSEETVVHQIKSGADVLHPFKVADGIVIPTDFQAAYSSDINKINSRGGVEVQGLTTKLPNDVLVLTNWKGIKSATASTPRFAFLSYDPKQGNKLLLSIFQGPSEALKYAKTLDTKVKRTTLLEFIIDNNKRIVNEFNDGLEVEKKRIEDLEKAKIEEAERKKKDAEAKELAKEEKRKKEAEANEEKRKKQEEEERKKKELAEEEQKYIKDKLKGVLQTDSTFDFVDERDNVKPPVREISGTANRSMRDKLNRSINDVDLQLRTDGVIIPGINKKVNVTLGNKIMKYYVDASDDRTGYITYLEIYKMGPIRALESHVFLGFASLRKYLKLDNVSDKQLVDHVVQHNIDTLESLRK